MRDSKTKTLRIYVVDNDDVHRLACKAIFESDGFELVGVETKSGPITLPPSRPDVLVMVVKDFDTQVCGQLCQLKGEFPALSLVVLPASVSADAGRHLRTFVQRCKSGVAVYLMASLSEQAQLRKTVMAAAEGQIVLDPAIAELMLPAAHQHPFLRQLTPRELEITQLLSQGHTNHAIADLLFIDIKTVEHHLNSIYSKMQSASDLHKKHPRVSATRMYLGLQIAKETTAGEAQNE